MTTILLVRHATHAEVGRVLSGRSEIALDAPGEAQADDLAMRLAHQPIGSIHASPRRRTRQTAAPLAISLGLPVAIAPALDEVDFGAFTGRSFDALAADPAWHRWNSERATFRCPSGETMAEATDRALAYLLSLADAAGPALLLTHCDVIRGLVCRALGLGLGEMFRFDCDPASVTRLETGGGDLRLLSLNERPR